jgi:hypothetical protein
MVILPAVAGTLGHSQRAACANNLREIGRGIHSWAGDHNGMTPWWVPIKQGGTAYPGKAGDAWFEFAALSNHLAPRVFACPADLASDDLAAVAPDWSKFLKLNFRQVSYSISLHAGRYDWESVSALSMDRNTRLDSAPSSCGAGINNAGMIGSTSQTQLAWTNSVHGCAGNLLFTDGTVEFTSTERLRDVFRTASRELVWEQHVLLAR